MNKPLSKLVRHGTCPIQLNSSGQTTQGSAPLEIGTPTIPVAIPDFDGLLPIAELTKDLEIRLGWWSGVEEDMRLQLAWKAFLPEDPNDPGDADLVGVRHDVTAAEAADTTTVFSLSVPSALLVHGVYILRVRARSFPGGVNDWSDRLTVRVDTEAPGGGALPFLTFPSNVEATKTITDADIVGAVLPIHLAHYEGIARGDTIQLYINTTASESEYLSVDPDPIGFIRTAYPEADLLAIGNGIKSFYYKVTDKAGNFDGSVAQNFNIQLRTTPVNIPAPTVPQADGNILDEAEARAGTNVGITAFTNAQAGDEIMVHWGAQTSARFPLQAGDLVNDPFITIQLAYNLVAAETVFGDVPVTFEVFRAGNSVGISRINTVSVDLRIPGGPDPDPETPINENLLPLTVQSPNGSRDNYIPAEDFEEDATATIPWLDVNDGDIYELADELEITWGSQSTTTITYTIVQQDLDDAVDLQFIIPTATIQAEGAGVDIPVSYTISRANSATPPGSNTAIAPPALVEVVSPDELPGAGDPIDLPVFTVLNEDDAIGPNQLIGASGQRYNPVLTKVNYANGAVGDTVQLFFSGYDRLVGGTLIPGATYEPPYRLTQGDLTTGTYEFRVPATYHFAVCSRGHVEAYVKFTNSSGSAQSLSASAYCDVKFPSDPDCSNYVP